MGLSRSSAVNVFRTLFAIVFVLAATSVFGIADVVAHARSRIVQPDTTRQVADAAWQQADLRDRVAVESTNALVQQPEAMSLLQRSLGIGDAGGSAGAAAAAQLDGEIKSRVLDVERAVVKQPRSRQLFVAMIVAAHKNFVDQVTRVRPADVDPKQTFVIDVRRFLPVVARQLKLGTAWVRQVPAGATVLRPTADQATGTQSLARNVARFVQIPTWLPWLVGAILLAAGLVLIPYRWVAMTTAAVGLVGAALVASGLGQVLDGVTQTGSDAVSRRVTHIIVEAFARDAHAIRNDMFIGAAVSAFAAIALVLVNRSRAGASF